MSDQETRCVRFLGQKRGTCEENGDSSVAIVKDCVTYAGLQVHVTYRVHLGAKADTVTPKDILETVPCDCNNSRPLVRHDAVTTAVKNFVATQK